MITAIAIAAAVLAASVGLNWWLIRDRQATRAGLGATRTELARVIRQVDIQRAHVERVDRESAPIRAKTAARLEREPSAVEVRRTLGRLTGRQR